MWLFFVPPLVVGAGLDSLGPFSLAPARAVHVAVERLDLILRLAQGFQKLLHLGTLPQHHAVHSSLSLGFPHGGRHVLRTLAFLKVPCTSLVLFHNPSIVG